MRWLRWVALLTAFLACLAPMAHLLELPNKFHLDGPMWLAVQQNLYRGWGPFIGAPTEMGGLILSLVLLAINRVSAQPALFFGLAAVAYGGMLLSFLLLNAPVNEAVNRWTPATLSVDWRWLSLAMGNRPRTRISLRAVRLGGGGRGHPAEITVSKA